MSPSLQRTAGRCEAAAKDNVYPLGATHRIHPVVGCVGCARYRAHRVSGNRNKSGTAEVNDRLCLLTGDKGVLFMNIYGGKSNGIQKYYYYTKN